MADQKISELTELTTPAGTDLLPIVDDVGGSPITKKISLTNLLSIGSATSHIIGEVVSGDIDGVNDEFTLANTPISGTVRVYHNRTRLKLTDDYTISGAVITLIDIPVTGDVVVADYMISAGDFATGSASFVSNEVPSGLVNSSNVTFTLVSTPVTGTLQLFRDGQLMKGGGVDYTLTTNSIEFVTAPTTGSVLLAFYQSSASTVGNADTLDGQHAPTGDIVGTTDTQTLTNKTLTSPTINNATFTGGGALLSKVYEFTRDMTATSGDVAITGIGFKPSSIIFIASINGAAQLYFGMVDSSKADKGMLSVDSNTFYTGQEYAIEIHTTINTDIQRAVVKSFDDDGFTLTWTKTGTPTGTMTVICLCFK